MTGGPPDGASKAELRRWATERRRAIDVGGLGVDLRRVVGEWLLTRPPTTVLLYRAMAGELSLDALAVDRTLGRRHRWATTRTPGSGPLTVHRWDAPLERHRFGFEQPVAGAPPVPLGEIGIVLAPGLLFDRRGGRLGHGRGYYDALLTEIGAGSMAVGVTCDALVVGTVPMEPHDVRMARLATEHGVDAVG